METADIGTFRRLHSREEAEALTADLRRLGFQAEMDGDQKPAGSAIMGTAGNMFGVKLPYADFEEAERALEKDIENENEVPADHYLLEFTDQELVDVVYEEEEWNALDRHWARLILAERGKPISDEALAAKRQQRLDDLRKEAPLQNTLVAVGYITAILGGLIGAIIGYRLNAGKKRLPNGERIPMYQERDRRHGTRIFFLGLIVFIVGLTLRLVRWFSNG